MRIKHAISQLNTLIDNTAANPEKVLLLAVSKGQSIESMQEAFEGGVAHFGENYLQEALVKMQALQSLPLCWHFIGPLQSNKAKRIATHFSWVHSLGNEKTARILSAFRPAHFPPLNVLIQVNLDEEETKGGVSAKDLRSLAKTLSELPHLRLRGLMAIPKPRLDETEQYESFMRLNRLLAQLNQELNLSMDTLSMGMSEDLVAAIRAGSTIVRIGRAIFGERA
ncbi:MAG: YggS family pyridoxal phosphate-dependent enzyme [Tatlockia sp.]|jgi:hypothetical protein